MNLNHATLSLSIAPLAIVLDSGLYLKHPAFLDINTIDPALGREIDISTDDMDIVPLPFNI
jgi:hypothetical protein